MFSFFKIFKVACTYGPILSKIMNGTLYFMYK